MPNIYARQAAGGQAGSRDGNNRHTIKQEKQWGNYQDQPDRVNRYSYSAPDKQPWHGGGWYAPGGEVGAQLPPSTFVPQLPPPPTNIPNGFPPGFGPGGAPGTGTGIPFETFAPGNLPQFNPGFPTPPPFDWDAALAQEEAQKFAPVQRRSVGYGGAPMGPPPTNYGGGYR